MLSVLIPTYNADCRPLVERVQRSAERCGVAYEIVVADDASPQVAFRDKNRCIADRPHCRYLVLERNVGPARLRNYLVSQARYAYLLFLDADVMPVSDDFIGNYWQAVQSFREAAGGVGGDVGELPLVVCGGFVYPRRDVPAQSALRYRYGIRVEERTAERRSGMPYRNFNSMNFLASRSCFERVRFDLAFHLGYEDTLFGMRLAEVRVPVRHIDNPVYHLVEEDSAAYLIKIERAVRNLIGQEQHLKSYVRLLQWYDRIDRFGLTASVAGLYRWTKGAVVRQLCGRRPSLKLFAFYKLGYFCELKRRAIYT